MGGRVYSRIQTERILSVWRSKMSLDRANGVTLEAAHTIIAPGLAHSRDSDFPPMTVAVLGAAGQLWPSPAKTDPASSASASLGQRRPVLSTWALAAEAWPG